MRSSIVWLSAVVFVVLTPFPPLSFGAQTALAGLRNEMMMDQSRTYTNN